MEESAGCGALVFMAACAWAIFHFSGYSVLIGRTEGAYGGELVWAECLFLNSTGIETRREVFTSLEWRSRFYCPRTKKVGE